MLCNIGTQVTQKYHALLSIATSDTSLFFTSWEHSSQSKLNLLETTSDLLGTVLPNSLVIAATKYASVISWSPSHLQVYARSNVLLPLLRWEHRTFSRNLPRNVYELSALKGGMGRPLLFYCSMRKSMDVKNTLSSLLCSLNALSFAHFAQGKLSKWARGMI